MGNHGPFHDRQRLGIRYQPRTSYIKSLTSRATDKDHEQGSGSDGRISGAEANHQRGRKYVASHHACMPCITDPTRYRHHSPPNAPGAILCYNTLAAIYWTHHFLGIEFPPPFLRMWTHLTGCRVIGHCPHRTQQRRLPLQVRSKRLVWRRSGLAANYDRYLRLPLRIGGPATRRRRSLRNAGNGAHHLLSNASQR